MSGAVAATRGAVLVSLRVGFRQALPVSFISTTASAKDIEEGC